MMNWKLSILWEVAEVKPKAMIQQVQIDAALCERHSAAVQKKLDTARVAIAGLGGLGSHVAFALARIGVCLLYTSRCV